MCGVNGIWIWKCVCTKYAHCTIYLGVMRCDGTRQQQQKNPFELTKIPILYAGRVYIHILRCAKSTGEARKRERLYFTAFIHTFFFYFSARFFFAFLTRLLIGCVCAFPNQVWINMHKTYCMSRERFVYLVSHACHDDDDGAVVKLAAISKIDSPAVILTDTQCRQRKMCTHHECWKWAKEKLESIICYVANGGF